jgi:hypothetical protein
MYVVIDKFVGIVRVFSHVGKTPADRQFLYRVHDYLISRLLINVYICIIYQ